MNTVTNDTLAALGLTREDLEEKLLDRLTDKFIDNDYDYVQSIHRQVSEQVSSAVVDTVRAKFDEHVLPRVDALVEEATFQKTNQWGEPRGESQSFKEFLVSEAERYLTEKVDSDGASKGEGKYQWKGRTTRLAWMVHKQLHHAVSIAMEEALKDANQKLAKSINEVVRDKLKEVTDSVQVAVKTRR